LGRIFSCKGGSAKNVHQQVSDHPATHKISGNERKPVAGQLVDAAQSRPQSLVLSGLAFKGVGCFVTIGVDQLPKPASC
jgi:hypothetical protein